MRSFAWRHTHHHGGLPRRTAWLSESDEVTSRDTQRGEERKRLQPRDRCCALGAYTVTRPWTRPPPLPFRSGLSTMLGRLLYVFLLLTNALAVLSEDRFLARSTFWTSVASDWLLIGLGYYPSPCCLSKVGWGTAQAQPVNQGFGQTYTQQYDQQGYSAGQDVGVKGRLINLISAVRTLMRSKYHLSQC